MTIDTNTIPTFALSEYILSLYDGTKLFYRAWLPSETPTRALFLFHRGHEHSGRFLDVVTALSSIAEFRETALFAWDARGHGKSPGDRGFSPSFATTIRDIDFFIRQVGLRHNIPLENTVVLGHSVAAVALAAWVHDYAPPVRGMVLATPAFRVKLYVPFARPALRLLRRIRGQKKTFITSYVKPSMLTHDPAHAGSYARDPLIANKISVNILLDLHDTATRILDDAPAIETPTLLLSAGADWVVKNSPHRKFFDRLLSPVKAFRHYPGLYHDLLHEKNREPILQDIRNFIEDAFSRPPAALQNTDQHGYTKTEFDRLRAPLPLSLRRANFALQRLSMKTLGQLSQGIRLGWRTGFSSGITLDYVYENQPRGNLLLGKIIDRAYLNAIGWRGIRIRKRHLIELLRETIAAQHQHNRPVHIVDVAAGPGRYLIEALHGLDRTRLTALLCDADSAALAHAQTLITHHNLPFIKTQQADAFDEATLAALHPAPTIAIISGLFELFPDNALVLRTLRGLAAAMQNTGGTLLYTGQPWHPQIEMIARVLIGLDKKPWIMRRRTQRELDFLVASAGFAKTDMRIDEHGIFTVSAATIGMNS